MTERPTEQTHPRLTGLDAPVTAAPTGPPTTASAGPRPQQRPRPPTGSPSPPSGSSRRVSRCAGRRRGRPARVRQPAVSAPDRSAAAGAERPRPAGRPCAAPAADQARRSPRRPRPSGPPARRAQAPARRARLRLTRIDPWSVMKTAFLLSIALGIVTVVAVLMVWSVLGAAGVWDSINTTVPRHRRRAAGDAVRRSRTTSAPTASSASRCWWRSIDVVLLTAIATLGGVPLQHGRGPARRHRGHPRGGRALSRVLRFADALDGGPGSVPPRSPVICLVGQASGRAAFAGL